MLIIFLTRMLQTFLSSNVEIQSRSTSFGFCYAQMCKVLLRIIFILLWYLHGIIVSDRIIIVLLHTQNNIFWNILWMTKTFTLLLFSVRVFVILQIIKMPVLFIYSTQLFSMHHIRVEIRSADFQTKCFQTPQMLSYFPSNLPINVYKMSYWSIILSPLVISRLWNRFLVYI